MSEWLESVTVVWNVRGLLPLISSVILSFNPFAFFFLDITGIGDSMAGSAGLDSGIEEGVPGRLDLGCTRF